MKETATARHETMIKSVLAVHQIRLRTCRLFGTNADACMYHMKKKGIPER